MRSVNQLRDTGKQRDTRKQSTVNSGILAGKLILESTKLYVFFFLLNCMFEPTIFYLEVWCRGKTTSMTTVTKTTHNSKTSLNQVYLLYSSQVSVGLSGF